MHRRKQLRLKNYDYSQEGYYFVTICIDTKKNLLCTIDNKSYNYPDINLTDIGTIVDKSINDIHKVIKGVQIDQYIIMPNHIHLIIDLNNEGGHGVPPLQDIIRRFKSFTTHEYNKIINKTSESLWQKNYYKHIIRDGKDLYNIRQYTEDNPVKWTEDEYYLVEDNNGVYSR